MARIQKVLLRMLFQLELLTLLNLERDFDTLAYKSEKGRERERRIGEKEKSISIRSTPTCPAGDVFDGRGRGSIRKMLIWPRYNGRA